MSSLSNCGRSASVLPFWCVAGTAIEISTILEWDRS